MFLVDKMDQAHQFQFLHNPQVNPETNRRIPLGGPKYTELVKRYGEPWKYYDAFRQWSFFVEGNVYGVKDENGITIGSRRANTRLLTDTCTYTIYIIRGEIHVWVEFGYTIPFYIPIDLIGVIPPQLYNTPAPHKSKGNWKMYNHAHVINH